MKKTASKRSTTRKKKVGSLPSRGGTTGNVKGGFLGSLSSSVKGVARGVPKVTSSP